MLIERVGNVEGDIGTQRVADKNDYDALLYARIGQQSGAPRPPSRAVLKARAT